ncbi:MAG TPA: hypothetical protein VFY97_10485 [Rhodanobacteraceae bacterium]|nr:hypothetical protein [Rhodanobacteraceae bacterium]
MLLAACSSGGAGRSPAASAEASPDSPGSAARPAAGRSITSADWGFSIGVPAGWAVRHGFHPSYLANAAWKTFAGSDSQGKPVLSLVMPGSNRISDAEIRIGASRAANEVRHCTTPPSAARAGSTATQPINGATFATFDARDAAMSHHLHVRAYRSVHDGACYAIDLLVFGADPEVYDPPATPPFSDAQAFRQMQDVLQTFRFTR